MRRYKKAAAFAGEYTVKEGDSLRLTAQKELGSGYQWTGPYEENLSAIFA